MCVIILKKPNIIIPFEKIESACHVNADGFGVAILNDNQTLTTYRSYNPKGNDPEELYDIMSKHQGQQQYIHLRYSTKGSKNLENCHPFTLINDEENKFELQFMHNGTLSYHGLQIPTGFSDTRAFAEGDAQRYSKIFYGLHGKEILQNDDYNHLMDRFLEDSWYFLSYDNLGNFKIQGKDGGTWHENDTWWSSNTYSFNRTHRTPNYPSYYSGSMGAWNSYMQDDNKEVGKTSVPFLPPKTNQTGSTNTSTTDSKNASATTAITKTTAKDECRIIGYALAEARRNKLEWKYHTPPEERATFKDLAGLPDLSNVCVMTEEEIHDLCCELPEAATTLIMDLIFELYMKQNKKKEAA